jgi:hypothetical protein
MRSAIKVRAITAPITIPAIAPPESFCFDDEAGVFEEAEEEAPVGETPIVMTDAVGVDTDTIIAEPDVPTVMMEGDAVGETVETMNSVLDAVVPTTVLDDASSEAHASSSWEVYCDGVPVEMQAFMKSPMVLAESVRPQFWTTHSPTALR